MGKKEGEYRREGDGREKVEERRGGGRGGVGGRGEWWASSDDSLALICSAITSS